MDKYPKISTLFPFNKEIKKFDSTKGFANENVGFLVHHTWLWSEKIDGTNVRIHWDGYNLSYKGRKDNSEFSAEQDEFLAVEIANMDLGQLIEQTFGEKEVYIFGELHGKNIQKAGPLYSDQYQFRVFDMKVNGIWINRLVKLEEIANGILGLEVAPLILVGTIDDAIRHVKVNTKSTFSDAPLEGLVGVPMGGLLDNQGRRIAVKVKKRDLDKTV